MRHLRRIAAQFLFLALALAAFSLSVCAASLPEYLNKIRDIKESLDIINYSDEEETNEAENVKFEREILKEIRAGLPANETVEWRGAGVEAENGWILEKLKQFEAEKNPISRAQILRELSERLGAIEAKLSELEAASKSARTKDEDKQKLAEILNRAEYRKPEEKKENFLQRIWRKFWKWLGNFFPSPKMGAPSENAFQSFSFVLQIIIFVVIAGIIGFLLYRFAPLLRARFQRRTKADDGARVILGERLAADETSANLFSEAEKLAREGNLRAAIRKGYIALLCELADRKVIGLAQHKTNRDYLRDVRNSAELHKNMSGLTGSFERHWYGFAAPDARTWEDFREKYEKAVGGRG